MLGFMIGAIGFIVVATAGVFTYIIIPVQNISIQQEAIVSELSAIQSDHVKISAVLMTLQTEIAVLDTTLKIPIVAIQTPVIK